MRLDTFDPCSFVRGMPYEFIGHGDPYFLLPFMEHELEAVVGMIGFSFGERIRLDPEDVVVELLVERNERIDEL